MTHSDAVLGAFAVVMAMGFLGCFVTVLVAVLAAGRKR